VGVVGALVCSVLQIEPFPNILSQLLTYRISALRGVYLYMFMLASCVKVAQMVQATRQNLDSIAVAMRGKMLEIQARQQGQRHREQQEAASA
jgi:hypothetical protein